MSVRGVDVREVQERLFLNSDAYRIHVCDHCGLIAVADLKTQSFACRGCNKHDVSAVHLPYAAKLLFQELMSMSIAPRILVRGGPVGRK